MIVETSAAVFFTGDGHSLLFFCSLWSWNIKPCVVWYFSYL